MLSDDPVAIVGVAIPAAAFHLPDETTMGLQVKAVQMALADAGMRREEINGACMHWQFPGGSVQSGSANWARSLGVELNWVIDTGFDSLGIRAALHAAAAIQAGLCETVCISSALAGGPAFSGAERMIAIHSTGSGDSDHIQAEHALHEFNHPYGGAGMPHRSALNARRHMHDYGTTIEQIAEVSATIRNYGHINPEATMYGRGPYTVDDVLASRWVAEPLHLLDCSVAGQGGAAIIMTSGRRARELGVTPVYVLGGAMALVRGTHADAARNAEVLGMNGARTKLAMDRAGIKPDDIDVLSLYDATSFEVISAIEMLGLCAEGEGGSYVEGGALAVDGRMPTNTDGGLLSHGWASATQLLWKVIEGVRQLRGSCGPRQVPGAEIALCTNSVPAAFHVETLILGKG
jgi:acetyl-CoA acetyltransferase